MTDATSPGSNPATPSNLPEMPAAAKLVKEGSVRAPVVDRELEAAPKTLQNAAWILLGGALFPFMNAGGSLLVGFGAKALGLLGCAMLAAGVFANRGLPVPWGLSFLAKPRFGPPFGAKPKNFVASVLAGIPTPLHLVGVLMIVAAPLVAWFDPSIAKVNAPLLDQSLPATASGFRAAAEVAALLLGGCTLAHILSYKKGGKFSPLYPFLFGGPAFMGLSSMFTSFSAGNPIAGIGALIVAVAAGIGLYAIGVAMVQAKKEGDLKREESLAAKRAARKTRA
jgi:hypothetical protein